MLALAAHPAASDVLVSNIGQLASHGTSLKDIDAAYGFTTGSNSHGYTLRSIEVKFRAEPDSTVSVRLATGLPGSTTEAATLTNPSTLGTGNRTFTAPAGTTLNADTNYFVVVSGGGPSAKLERLVLNRLDSGGAPGWSLFSNQYSRPSAGGNWSTSRDGPMQIRVNGTVHTPPATPAAPAATAAASSGSLSVSWTAPSDNGSAITDHDLRYYAGSADPEDDADWIEDGESTGLPDPGTATSAAITGLTANTAYRVQVRAQNAHGESPWSASGAATTGTPPATNNAPRLLTSSTAADNACQVKTGTGTPSATLAAPADDLVSLAPLVSRTTETADFPATCTTTPASDRVVPVFDDKDADALTVTLSYTLPDNVFAWDGYPSITRPTAADGGRISFRGVAALHAADLRIDLAAVDPHGASAGTHAIFQVATPDNAGTPSFAETVSGQTFIVNEPIAGLSLPAATGGDVIVRGGTTLFSYVYDLSGLPDGLVFDPATRTVSGTPATTGAATVTYQAEDADGAHTAGGDPADTASLTFAIDVVERAAIESVEIASVPGFDTDDDGSADTYGRNETIRVRAGFTRAVSVDTSGGTPRLQIRMHPDYGDKWADYESGHGTAMLTFAYRVVTGNFTTAGIAVRANTLELNGGAIAGADDRTAATLTHAGLDHDPDHQVDHTRADTTRPVLQTAAVTAETLTLTYGEALDTGSVPDADDFTVQAAASAVSLASADPVQVSGSTVTLTLAAAVADGQTVTVSYTADTKPIQDWSGNGAVNLTDRSVDNLTDTTGPELQSAAVNGLTQLLTLTYDEALDTGSVPDADDFTVQVAGSETSLAAADPVTVRGSAVTLALASPITDGQTVTVSYTTGTKPIQDALGNAAANLSDEGVTNDTAPGSVPPGMRLVSNTGQASGASTRLYANAQAFTTGSSAVGYKLTGVVIEWTMTELTKPSPGITVSVRSANGSGKPADRLGNLTNPASFRSGLNTFTASGAGIDLDPSTTYVVVIEVAGNSATRPVYIHNTSSGAEDSGAAEGWSIANHTLYQNYGSWHELHNNSRKIRIYGNVSANSPPGFPSETPTELSVAENSAAGAAVGTVAATDADDDAVTYTLDETSAAVFGIDETGTITVTADGTLDFEGGTARYAATVSVTDGKAANGSEDSAIDATHAVTIAVTDVDEPPAAPEAPAVAVASASSVTVTWTAPDMTGKPEITGYDVQYRVSGANDWTDASFEGAETTTTIAGLTGGTDYQAQVRATNDEGTGDWSATGSGATSGAAVSSVAFADPPSGGVHRTIGSHVEVEVTFNQVVTVAGTPRIELSPAFGPDGETRHAAYISGSGTAALVFRYTLAEGDDSAGVNVSVAANALDADGADGTAGIRAGATDAAADHAEADAGAPVAAVLPAIVRASGHPAPGADGDLDGAGDTYVAGDEFGVRVRFAEAMAVTGADADGGNVQIVVAIGGTHHTLNYLGTAGGELEFGTYTVVAADSDTDGIAITRDASGNLVRLSGGATVTGASGNDAALGAAADLSIGGAAEVSAVNVRGTNTAPSGSAAAKQTATGAAMVFAASDFAIADGDGDPLTAIRITTLPASLAGALTLNGASIAAADLPQTVTHTEMAAGTFRFEPGAAFSGSASFTFKVVDPFGAAAAVANTATLTVGQHTVPAFAAPEATVSIDENHPDGASVGTVAATDAEGDTLAYWLTSAGTDHGSFTIGDTGEIRVKSGVTLDFEARSSYAVTVQVSDGERANGNPETAVTIDDTIAVTIEVNNVAEPPEVPAAPAVTAASSTSLSVSWTAPSGTGAAAAVADYDLRYRASGASAWTDAAHDGTATGATITGLSANTAYDVQVRAEGDGESAWSDSGSATTDAGPADTQAPALASATVRENTLTLTYGEALDVNSVPDADDFTVKVAGSARGVSEVAVAGNAVTLTLASAVTKAQTVKVSYTADARPIRDAAGNDAADLSERTVTNVVPEVVTNAYVGVADIVSITFSGNLSSDATLPAPGDFTVKANGSEVALRNDEFAVSGALNLLDLRLDSRLTSDDVVTVSYTKGTTPLMDANGNEVDSFVDRSVTSRITPFIDSVAISSSPSHDSDGDNVPDTYVRHDRIVVDVTFNAAVRPASDPPAITLRLDVGEDDSSPGNSRKDLSLHSRVNGNRTLRFAYTVQDTDVDTDGVWAQTERGKTVLFDGNVASVRNGQTASRDKAGLPSGGNPHHKVDGSRLPGSLTPKVTAVEIVSQPKGANDTYGAGETIQVQLTFDKAVNVGATPWRKPRLLIKMDPGYGEKWAGYAGGSGTTRLVFGYAVAAGNSSPQGIAVLQDTLALNGGSIHSAATGLDAALSHAGLGHDANHKVNSQSDAVPPAFVSASVDGAALDLHFDEAPAGGSPPAASAFTVTVGGAARTVSAVSIDGSRVTLTLASAVTDADTAIKVGYTKPDSNALRDASGNETASFADKGVDNVSADRTAPTVTRARVNGRILMLEFSETFSISFTPLDRLGLSVDGTPADDTLLYGGGGGKILRIVWNGSAVLAGQTVTLSYTKGDTTEPFRDLAGNELADFSDLAVINVSGRPEVQTVELVSSPRSGQGNTYKLGDEVRARVTFDTPVDVAGGSPLLKLRLNWTDSGERDMTLDSAAGTTNTTVLDFTYTVAPGDESTQGITIQENRLSVPEGVTIRGHDSTTNAGLDYRRPFYESSEHKVDGVRPTLWSAVVGGTALTLTYDEALDATSVPAAADFTVADEDGARLELADTDPVVVRGRTVTLTLASPVSSRLTVSYTAGANPIRNLTGNAAADFAGRQMIFGTLTPAVIGVALVSAPASGQNDTYKPGDEVRARVTFRTAVDVEGGSPLLKLQFDPDWGTKNMTFDASHGVMNTRTLEFTYTVVARNDSPQGIALYANQLTLPAGVAIRATGTTTDANLKFARVGHDANHKVDGWRPSLRTASPIQVTSSAGSDGTYAIGDHIELAATFTEAITVTTAGSPVAGPRIPFTLGAATRHATYHSGSGTAAPVFRYTVAAGDADTDGIAVAANALERNGGAITDLAGNTGGLGHGAMGAQANHKVDGVRPVLSGAAVAGTALELSYSKALDASSLPAAGDFAVHVGGSAVSLAQADPVAMSGSTVTLTLASAAAPGQAVTVSYSAGANPIRDAAGNAAADLAGRQAANGNDNKAPGFPATAPKTLSVDENSAGGTAVGTVAAEDPDAGDTLVYSLDSVSDALFDIDASGAITVTAGATLDHETTPSYALTVRVSDGKAADGGADGAVDATHAVTVQVTNVAEPPSAPPAPATTAQTATSLTVSWAAPADSGAAAVADYDLRYFAGSLDPEDDADWIEEGEANGPPDPGASTSATITGLTANTAYRVQVRAAGDGEGAWSASGSGVTNHQSAVSGVALVGAPAAGQNDTYRLADEVRARVTFDRAVNVTGSPVLKLQFDPLFGEKDMTFDASGGRTNVTELEFTYTVVAGNLSTEGIAFYANKLRLPAGATIRTAGATSDDANLAFAKVDHDTSHKVDGGLPVLSHATVDGAALTLHYSEPLLSSPAPAVGDFTVTVAGSDRTPTAVAVSGAQVTLTLSTAVTAREAVTVTYAAGANPIRDPAGNAAADVTGRTVSNITGDTTPPRLVSATWEYVSSYSEVTFKLYFSEALDSTRTPATTDFRMTGNTQFVWNPLSVAISGATITLEDPYMVGASFLATSTTIDLRDLAGNRMAPITEWFNVTSLNDPDPGKPVLVSTDAVVVDGDTLTLTYDKALHGGAVPPTTAFTVAGTDATTTVDAVGISGRTLLLTLNPAVAQGDTEITVSYDKTNPPRTQNPWGTQADAFSNQAVTNDTSAPTVPAFAAETASFEIAEDNADAASVGTVAATDADGDALTYSLASGGDNDSFTIDSGTGEIKVKSGVTLNFDAQSSYTVTAQVTDGEDANGDAETGTPTTDDTITVTITVTVAPVAADFAKTTPEDTTLTFAEADFTGAFSDADGHTLQSVEIVTLPDAAQGTLMAGTGDARAALQTEDVIALADLGTVQFEPAADFSGDATFTYKVTDSSGAESADAATVTVTVTVAPVAADIAKTTPEDTTLTFAASDFEDAFSDADGHTLQSVKIVTLPAAADGTLMAGADDTRAAVQAEDVIALADLGTVQFEPAADFNGDATFTYKVTDSSDAESADTATVTVTVDAADDLPVAADFGKTTPEDTTLTFAEADFESAFSDADGHTLQSMTVATLPAAADGTLKVGTEAATVDQTVAKDDLGTVTFEPAADFSGDATFTYKVTDSSGAESSDSATVTVTVTAAPVAADFGKTTPENTTLTFAASDFEDAFSDADGHTLKSVTIATLPAAADGTLKVGTETATVDQTVAKDDLGTVTFEPATDFNGDATFTYKATDSSDAESSEAATVTVTVSATDDLPVASDFGKTTAEDTTLTFAATDFEDAFSDADGHTLKSVTIATLPAAAAGTLKVGTAAAAVDQTVAKDDLGTVTFEPATDFNGDATFTYKVTDSSDAESSEAATVTVTVSAADDLPVAADIAKTTPEDTTLTFAASDFEDAFSDADGHTLKSVTIATLPAAADGTLKVGSANASAGDVVLAANLGTVQFEPASDFSGDATFTYKVTDSSDAESSEAATVTVTVSAADDLPVASVSGAEVTSDSGPDGVWGEGETIEAALTFSSAVTVGTADGTPTLALIADGIIRRASYASGSGTERLVFAYQVSAADGEIAAVRPAASGLRLNGGAIVDEVGTAAALAFGDAPGVTSVSIVDAADGSWAAGDAVEATLRFAEPVTVEGAPAVSLVAAGKELRAAYVRGSGTDALTFAYTLDAIHGPWSRVALLANSLRLGGGSIVSAGGGLAAALAHAGTERTLELAPGPPRTELTASFVGMPAEHDGKKRFSFELRFNREFSGLRLAAFDAGALEVTNGRLIDAKRMVPGQNRRVMVRVRPTSNEDVTVTLPATADCAAPEAICAAGGRKFANPVSATVPGPASTGPELTASFVGMPAEHDGKKLFSFEIRFDREFTGLRLPAFKAGALEVTNGRLIDAKRVVPGENRRVTVRVRPASNEDMTVTLPATADCAAPGAICTAGGQKLANLVSATVLGPALLSVADAEAREGIDPAVEFAVRLSRAASGEVTVDYATADGTATAGEDYTASRGTLTFAAGEREQTVSVAVLDDAHDEGRETFLLRLSNATGAHIEDGEATGAILNTDAMPGAWLARFGRTLAEQVLGGVQARLEASRAGGAQARVAGQALGDGYDEEAARLDAEALGLWLAGAEERPQTVTGQEVVAGSAFALTAAAEEGTSAALWGRGGWSRFDGRDGALRVDGEVLSAALGADYRSGGWLAGAMLGHARGEGSYAGDGGDGTVTSAVTGVFPYAGVDLSERLTAWAAAGLGLGGLTLTPEAARELETDLALVLAALGARGRLLEPAGGSGFSLALDTDALWVRTSSEAAPGLAEAQADVTRLRLGLDGGYRFVLDGGGALEPSFAIGVRHDGGDAENGYGMDLGGGLAWTDRALGLAAELSARGLLTYGSEGFRDVGVSGSLAWDPDPSSDRGPSVTVVQTLGSSATGGMDALLGRATLAGLAAPGDGLDSRRLELRAGYGLAAFGDRFTATPELGLALAPEWREYRLGWGLTLAAGGPTAFELGLEATRRERHGAAAPPEHSLGASVTGRW